MKIKVDYAKISHNCCHDTRLMGNSIVLVIFDSILFRFIIMVIAQFSLIYPVFCYLKASSPARGRCCLLASRGTL